MSAVLQMERTYVDISQWWPTDSQGDRMSVNAVFERNKGTECQISRHTLTRARDGKLEKGGFTNLMILAKLCSRWSKKDITVNDLFKKGE